MQCVTNKHSLHGTWIKNAAQTVLFFLHSHICHNFES